jgi:hypothetical protein
LVERLSHHFQTQTANKSFVIGWKSYDVMSSLPTCWELPISASINKVKSKTGENMTRLVIFPFSSLTWKRGGFICYSSVYYYYRHIFTGRRHLRRDDGEKFVSSERKMNSRHCTFKKMEKRIK